MYKSYHTLFRNLYPTHTPPLSVLGIQRYSRSVGAFGYFPSYTLGAVMACQFFEAAKKAIPDLDHHLETGNFGPLKSWLNKEVG